MSTRTSNGTGGGYFDVAATWAGGVVPSGSDIFQILPGDTVSIRTPIALTTNLSKIGTTGVMPGPKATLKVLNGGGSLTTYGVYLYANGVLQVGDSATLFHGDAYVITTSGIIWMGGDILLYNMLEDFGFSGSIQGVFYVNGFEDGISRTITVRNPHYCQAPLGGSLYNFGHFGTYPGSYGPSGHLFDFIFDTVPTVINIPFFGLVVPSTLLTIDTIPIDKNTASPGAMFEDFGFAYSAIGANYLPMVVPVIDGAVASDVTVELWSVNQSDLQWAWKMTLPNDAPLGSSLLVTTYADDGAGHWTLQQLRADIQKPWATAEQLTLPTLTGPATTLAGKIEQIWRRLFKMAVEDGSTLKTYADDGATVVTTQSMSDDGTTQTQGAAT